MLQELFAVILSSSFKQKIVIFQYGQICNNNHKNFFQREM